MSLVTIRTIAMLPLALATLAGGVSPAHAQSADTLVVDASFQLKTADPARQFEPTASLVLHPVYETLVTFEGGDLTEVVPSLAGVPEISDDARTFTFQLNPDALFSDGSPVTVDDVVFSLERVRDLKGNPSFLMEGVSVAAGSGDGQVVLTSELSDPGLPFKLTNPSLGIVNADVVTSNGGTADPSDGAEQFLAATSVGSGPYVLETFDISSEVVLTRNEGYWGEASAFAKIVFRNVESNAQQMNVARGAHHIAIDLRPDQVGAIGDSVNVGSSANADVAFLFTNADPGVSEVTSNPDFREAVRYGIDYAGIVEFVGEGALQPGSVIPSMFGGALAGDRGAQRDVAKAKEALSRSGLDSPSVALGYASDLTKHGIAFADIAAKVQSDLAEVGIDVQLRPMSLQSNIDSYRDGSLEMSVQWWGPDFPDPSNYLLFGPGQLVGLRAGWKEGAAPELTALGERAAVAVDPDERTALYEEWQLDLNEAGPFVSLFQPAATLVSTRDLEPLAYNPMWTVDVGDVTPVSE